MGDSLPLFPLDTVLFPGVLFPLHVFEDRYRQLVDDVLAYPPGRDREFGVVAIRPAATAAEDAGQTIHRVGCTALLTGANPNRDGTYEVVTIGRRRFRVAALAEGASYLCAEVQWLTEPPPRSETQVDLDELSERAVGFFATYRDLVAEVRGDDILMGPVPTDPINLSYTIAAAMVLPLAERQSLLESPDSAARLRLAISLLRRENAAIRAIPSLPANSLPSSAWAIS